MGVVIHLPKKPPTEIYKGIRRLELGNSRLILEMESYHANENTYETPEKAKALFTHLIDNGISKSNLGFCIDTAHLHSAGIDIKSRENAQLYLDKLTSLMPPQIPIMVHLNDQAHAFASGKDNHASLTYGTLWSEYNVETGTKKLDESGIIPFLTYPSTNAMDYPVIIERKPELIANDFKVLTAISTII